MSSNSLMNFLHAEVHAPELTHGLPTSGSTKKTNGMQTMKKASDNSLSPSFGSEAIAK